MIPRGRRFTPSVDVYLLVRPAANFAAFCSPVFGARVVLGELVVAVLPALKLTERTVRAGLDVLRNPHPVGYRH